MDKIDQLFVRACKSNNPVRRLRSVYRRFYMRGISDNVMWGAVASRLTVICEENVLEYAFRELLDNMNPSCYWRNGIEESDHYSLKVVKILSSVIRYSEADKFKGLSTPRKFR